MAQGLYWKHYDTGWKSDIARAILGQWKEKRMKSGNPGRQLEPPQEPIMWGNPVGKVPQNFLWRLRFPYLDRCQAPRPRPCENVIILTPAFQRSWRWTTTALQPKLPLNLRDAGPGVYGVESDGGNVSNIMFRKPDPLCSAALIEPASNFRRRRKTALPKLYRQEPRLSIWITG